MNNLETFYKNIEVRNGNLKDSKFGSIPKGWEVKKLKDCLDEFNCKSTENDQHEVFTSSSKGLIRQTDYFGANRITRRDTKGFNIIPNKYLTYRSRSDSNAFYFNQNDLGKIGLVSKYYPVFKAKDGIELNKFFVFLLNYYSEIISQESVGTSQVVLSYKALSNIQLPIPPLKEQFRISSILESLEELIKKKVQKLNGLINLKNALTKDLLSGRRKVKI